MQENILNLSTDILLAYHTFLCILNGSRISIITEDGMLFSVLYLLQGKRKYLDTLHKYLEIHGTFGAKVLGLLLSLTYYLKLQTNQQTKN